MFLIAVDDCSAAPGASSPQLPLPLSPITPDHCLLELPDQRKERCAYRKMSLEYAGKKMRRPEDWLSSDY